MVPWLIAFVKDVNERMMTEREVEQLIAFLDTCPARIKLSEDLERFEPELVAHLVEELPAAHPERLGYTREAIRDMVESLRHLFVSIWLDEPEFMNLRWTHSMQRSLAASGLDEEWAGDIYRAIDEKLRKMLRGTSAELYRGAMDRLLESLSAPVPA